jgi:hypothetical protein
MAVRSRQARPYSAKVATVTACLSKAASFAKSRCCSVAAGRSINAPGFQHPAPTRITDHHMRLSKIPTEENLNCVQMLALYSDIGRNVSAVVT